MKQLGTLVFFCGKMGAGKSTMAKKISTERNAVLISEDDWLAAHFPNQITTFDDYLRFSSQVKPFIKSHVQNILSTGVSVVMDFPANTASQRKWFKVLISEIECPHELVVLDVSDEQCLAQISQRRSEQPERAQFDTEEVFHHVSQYFELPADDEGFITIAAHCS